MATYKTLKDLMEQEEKKTRTGQSTASGQQTRVAAPKVQGGGGVSTGAASGAAQGETRQTGAAAQSDPVGQAHAMLQQQVSGKPGAYSSAYRSQLEEMADRILNQGAFTYDVNGDALYQQLVDQYAAQGRLAMMDTMGQAQAMTGGYGNSYAQTAGQQAYQGYLRQAADQLPQFYSMALDRYDRERDALRDQYALLLGQEEADYSRYRDQLSDYYAQLDRLRDQYYEERDYEYRKDRDETADRQWQAELEETIRQFNHKNGIRQAEGEYARWLREVLAREG